MIHSADEFIRLRTSNDPEEQYCASHDEAAFDVWLEIVNKYPEYKPWVIHNKTIPIGILELLARDHDPDIRAAVARKRKINEQIFLLLASDPSEDVRYALMCNTALGIAKKKAIQTADSTWLKTQLEQIVKKSCGQ